MQLKAEMVPSCRVRVSANVLSFGENLSADALQLGTITFAQKFLRKR
jgi:hypothetical protein